MKKTIIASTILTTLSFGSFAAQVNIEEANLQTHLLVENQMAQIDARTLELLDSQSGSVVTIDDTVYQKDAKGTWAVIGSTSAALAAGLLTSSSSSSKKPVDGGVVLPEVTPSNPVYHDPSNPIQGTPEADNGRSVEKIAENAWSVSMHDELEGYIVLENGEFTIRNADGEYVGTWKPTLGNPIEIDPSNPIQGTPEADNGRSVEKIADNAWSVSMHDELEGYIVLENGEFTIRNADGEYVGTWKPTLGNPIEIDPSNPIQGTPEADNGRSVEKIADNAWSVSMHDDLEGYIVLENGEFTIRNADGEYVGTWKPTLGNPIEIDPSNPIQGTPEADNGRSVEKIADNAWSVSMHDELEGYIVLENGEFTIRNTDGDYVGTWKPTLGNPIEIDPSNPIQGTPEADNGRSVEKIAENAWSVSMHDELEGYIVLENGEFTIRNADGDYVGTWKPTLGNPIEIDPSNPIQGTPEADNGRSVEKIAENAWSVSMHDELEGYIVLENGEFTIRNADGDYVGTWKPTLGNPIEIDPSNPIQGTPEADNGRSVEKIAENAWSVSMHDELEGYIVLENGEFTIRNADGDYVGTWKPTLGNPIEIDPSNPIQGTPEADNGRSIDKIADNAWTVSTHGEVDGYVVVENGGVTVRDSDLNEVGSWAPGDNQYTAADVRKKFASLSQEQRSNIRQMLRNRK